jgi:ketosteroid isomerase-like protein
MIDGDSVMLDKLTTENLLYGHSSGQVQDKPAFIHSFTSSSSDFVTIDLTEQTITLSGNTAIVRHKLSATTNDNGKPGAVKLVVMTVWQKHHKDWKMIARQAVRPPQ